MEPRHLPVRWLEQSWTMEVGNPPTWRCPGLDGRTAQTQRNRLGDRSAVCAVPVFLGGRTAQRWNLIGKRPNGASAIPTLMGGRGGGRTRGWPRAGLGTWHGRRGGTPRLGFTVLEMLVVVAIIGFLAALAMPALSGLNKSNSITAATQQITTATALARQLALKNRSTVYLVFVSPGAFPTTAPTLPANCVTAYNNLQAHQYTAYALMSPRTVGDQPGRPNPQYLTEWKTLPTGVFIPTFMFGGPAQTIWATNTLAPTNNWHSFYVTPFNQALIPFPAANGPATLMPCVGFSSQGPLTTNVDVYIPLARGSVRFLPGAGGAYSAFPNETPSGNSTNDCNIIHIDCLTGRAKVERNQF
ncbi:MAG: prepilin-type N-terminal cleavage/methylation domain-containing protein [Verrucomicrobiota bacterium]